MQIKRILVIRVGNLGDVLMATPVLRKLKNVFPDSRIDFLTSGMGRVVMQENANLNQILIYGKYKRLGAGIRKFIFERSLARNRYDLCVVLEEHPQYHQFARNVMGKHGLKIGISTRSDTKYLDHTLAYNHHEEHTIETALFLLRDFLNIPIDQDDYLMDFTIPDSIEKKLTASLSDWRGKFGKYFVIHAVCNGYKYYRIWDLANYLPVIRFLRTQGYKVFLTGAKSDQPLIDEVMKEWRFKGAEVEGFVDRPLSEAAFLIKHAAGVLSADTGIMHIARAMRTPIVALFGPTNPLHTGCIGSGEYVQIRNDFKCGPCSYYPEYRLEYKQICIDEARPPACMRSITVEQVMEGLKKILGISFG